MSMVQPTEGLQIATMASLLADPARASMLVALLGDRALPAGELAAHALVTPQTASSHLARMVELGLLEVERAGRHRYFRLSRPEVGLAIEALGSLHPQRANAVPKDARRETLRFARTCYDHLAGQLGVAVTEALLGSGVIVPTSDEPSFELTSDGGRKLAEWGMDVEVAKAEKRIFARRCLDWTERRHHIGGSLGAHLLRQMTRLGWVARRQGTRAVILTDAGREGLASTFGVAIPVG